MPDNDQTMENPGNESQDAPNGADLDVITQTLAEASPEVNRAAVGAAELKDSQVREQYADLRDVKGNRFDPAMHVTDTDGSPKLTPKGKLRLRPGLGSAKGSASGKVGGVSAKVDQGTGLTSQQKMQARATGEAAAGGLIMLGVVIGGDEWQPVKDDAKGVDERAYLSQAFGDYFEATGRTDIPPGVALSVAIIGYAAPRFTMPKTQSKTRLFFAWVRDKFSNFKRKGKDNGSRADSRNDGKRENNPGETPSRKPEK